MIREGRLLARVRHPNVVTVYGAEQHEGAVGLWMEWVEGLTLKQQLAARGVLGGQEAALIGIDVCRAVAAVHKAGLLHRDIKAQNVMREAGGRIVLMDFGAGEIRHRARAGARDHRDAALSGARALRRSARHHRQRHLQHRRPAVSPLDDAISGRGRDGRGRRIGARTHGISHRWPTCGPISRRRCRTVIERALDRDPARRFRSSGAMQQSLASALELQVPGDASGARAVDRPSALDDARPSRSCRL